MGRLAQGCGNEAGVVRMSRRLANRIKSLESVLGVEKVVWLISNLEFTNYREVGGDGTYKSISEVPPGSCLVGMRDWNAPTWEEVKAESENKLAHENNRYSLKDSLGRYTLFSGNRMGLIHYNACCLRIECISED